MVLMLPWFCLPCKWLPECSSLHQISESGRLFLLPCLSMEATTVLWLPSFTWVAPLSWMGWKRSFVWETLLALFCSKKRGAKREGNAAGSLRPSFIVNHTPQPLGSQDICTNGTALPGPSHARAAYGNPNMKEPLRREKSNRCIKCIPMSWETELGLWEMLAQRWRWGTYRHIQHIPIIVSGLDLP